MDAPRSTAKVGRSPLVSVLVVVLLLGLLASISVPSFVG